MQKHHEYWKSAALSLAFLALAVFGCARTQGVETVAPLSSGFSATRTWPSSATSQSELRQKWPRLWADLLIGLLSLSDEDVEYHDDLPLHLQQTIARNQPQSGELLLSMIADANHSAHRRAVFAFVSTWQTMNDAQMRAYFRSAVRLNLRQRATYPLGAPGAVGFDYAINYSWDGWPKHGETAFPADDFKTRSTHILDGKQFSAFSFQGPMATTEWIDTHNLSLGKHVVSSQIRYEYSYRGKKFEDAIESPQWSFEVVPDTGDTLIAAPDTHLDNLVRKSFQVAENEQTFGLTSPLPFEFDNEIGFDGEPLWRPQVTWDGKDGLTGYHFPIWKMTQSLPVDLCFETEIEDLETGKKFPANPVVVRRGEIRNDYLYPDETDAFMQGRSGFVRIRITFKPSRMHALSDPHITRYYGKGFTTDVMRAKLFNGDADSGGE